MGKKLYLVTGLPSIIGERSEEFRQDLKIYKQNNEEVSVRVPLTSFQAFMARIQTIQYNMSHVHRSPRFGVLRTRHSKFALIAADVLRQRVHDVGSVHRDACDGMGAPEQSH